MGTISANKEIIKLYARQLKTPTFLNWLCFRKVLIFHTEFA